MLDELAFLMLWSSARISDGPPAAVQAACVYAAMAEAPDTPIGLPSHFELEAELVPGHAVLRGTRPWRVSIDRTGAGKLFVDEYLEDPPPAVDFRVTEAGLLHILKALDRSEFFQLKTLYGTPFDYAEIIDVKIDDRSHEVDFRGDNARDRSTLDDYAKFRRTWTEILRVMPQLP